MKSEEPFNAERQVRAMLDRGWAWRDPFSSTLVHPQDHDLFVVYDREGGTLTYSSALLRALDLVILTPPGINPHYWPDEKRAHPRKKQA